MYTYINRKQSGSLFSYLVKQTFHRPSFTSCAFQASLFFLLCF